MKNYSPYYGDIIIDKDHAPIVVYIVGKVGSKTVTESIYNLENIPYSIYHVQQLSPEIINETEEFVSKASFNSAKQIQEFNIKFSNFLLNHFDDFKWKVITLTRDPLAIALSMVFEFLDVGVLDNFYPELYKDGKLDSTFENFSKAFHLNCFKQTMYVQNWFDVELKKMFGIDVYDYPFDKEKGYSIIKERNIELLIIRSEDLNKCFRAASKEFLGLDIVNMINNNVGDEKYYSDVYKFVKDKFELKKAYADDIYFSKKDFKYLKHFYTNEEVDKFIDKWTALKVVTRKDYELYGVNPENIFDHIENEIRLKMEAQF